MSARRDEIAKRLAAVPNLPWDFGAGYEIWQRQEWGARRVASITEVPNDTEDAMGRYSVTDFIAHAPDDVRWLLDALLERESEPVRDQERAQ